MKSDGPFTYTKNKCYFNISFSKLQQIHNFLFSYSEYMLGCFFIMGFKKIHNIIQYFMFLSRVVPYEILIILIVVHREDHDIMFYFYNKSHPIANIIPIG
ncbi:hypothetical protein L474_02095 [Escherichia coli BIDMC 37]|nr:hypothetical protein L474_02095 [Escherichia coli BIDMC 37]